jgi:hypothetical protein
MGEKGGAASGLVEKKWWGGGGGQRPPRGMEGEGDPVGAGIAVGHQHGAGGRGWRMAPAHVARRQGKRGVHYRCSRAGCYGLGLARINSDIL